jgi:catalase
MKRSLRRVGLGLAAALLAGTASAETLRPLLSHALANAAGETFTAVEVDFAPGGSADPHRHGQAFVYAYVLAGEIRSQLGGEPVRTYRVGDSWFEPPGAHHVLTQNPGLKTPTRLLVVFVAPTGAPLKIPDPEESHPMTHQASPSASAAPTGERPSDAKVGTPAAEPAPQAMIDALHAAFGEHRARAVHAKGVMAQGVFEPAPGAAALSRASLFRGPSIPVLARFSDFTGLPDIPDDSAAANPRGFALKFELANGDATDVVSHSFNGFPTATSEDFRALLLAIGASRPGAQKPTALEIFLAAHPVAKAFLTTQKPLPASYATLSYFGVNSFAFTNAAGQRRFVRYRFIPVGGEVFAPLSELQSDGPNYLQTELPARLAKGPVAFEWWAQEAGAADVIGDPSVAWPESRVLVKLGVIRLTRMVAEPAAADRATMFDPTNVPDGIAPADPMLDVRRGAYPISFSHRQ